MSIRKRLLLSNVAMIAMPIIIIILIIILLNIVFSGSSELIGNNFKQRWQSPEGPNTELFNKLKKVASLEQEKLFDRAYLDLSSKQLENEHAEVVIRKGDDLLYASNRLEDISNEDLPSFGNEGYDPAGARFGHDHYSIRQHDFYFKDGMEGSIFLLNNSVSFVKFARIFFPVLFISLIFILVLTNVLLSYFTSRSILRPVNQLTAASIKISKGDFNFTLRTKSKDELGQLVKSFDTMRAQLQESLLLRDKYENNRRELIANISHDLKTPVTSIIGYVEGIQDGVASSADKQAQYLHTIHSKAKYINGLIEELSFYSKLDVKKLPFHFESVDVKAFITDYLEEIETEIKEKGIQISLDKKAIHADVSIDRDQLIRVMENIIYNSVKYMDKSPGYIVISLTDQGHMIKVSIHDNGPGIYEKDLATIFNRFYQVDPSRGTAGSGLGLAIASQIIEAHSGTIWAESLPYGGLGVHFTLKKSKDDQHE